MIKQVQFACPECASTDSRHEGETLRFCQDCGQDWHADLDYSKIAAQHRQEGERHGSGIRGAENREGHSSGRTGGASDLPELRSQEELDRMDRASGYLWWLLIAFLFAVALVYALPDLRAWWSGKPPVMIGGQP